MKYIFEKRQKYLFEEKKIITLDKDLWKKIYDEKDSQLYVFPNICLSAEGDYDFIVANHNLPSIKVFKATGEVSLRLKKSLLDYEVLRNGDCYEFYENFGSV